MAKIFLIIVCVCYCTACANLIAAHMLQKDIGKQYDVNGMDSNSNSDKYKFSDGYNDENRHASTNLELRQNDDYSSRSSGLESNLAHNTKRVKRHAGHNHNHGANIDLGSLVEMNPNTREFIRKLFRQFGKSEDTMTLNEFEEMARQLGLYRLIEEKHLSDSARSNGVNSKQNDNQSIESHNNETCVSSLNLVSHATSIQRNAANRKNIENYENSLAEIRGQSKFLNKSNTRKTSDAIDNETSFETIKSIKENINLGENDLWSLCPILLYQLAATSTNSLERSGCITSKLAPSDSQHDHHIHFETDSKQGKTLNIVFTIYALSIVFEIFRNELWPVRVRNRILPVSLITILSEMCISPLTNLLFKVWIYASLSILIASLCGLIGVAVIPCMEKRYYNHVLQFFVALAIGTLAGDALLHLMPHAMMTFSTLEDKHTNMTYKGLVAALGIIFFFLTERILTVFAEQRKRKQKRDDPPARVRVMRDPDSISVNNSLNGEKQCKHKYSSYPYCYDEIALDTKDNHHQHHQHGSGHSHSKENGVKLSTSPPKEKLCAKSLNDRANDYSDTAQSLLNSRNHNNISMNDSYYRNGDKDDIQTPDNNTILTNLDDGSLDACGCEHKKTLTPENYTVILREHESKHHGHSHTHGHVHSPPKTLSAVAWMVVMGDGLHNFTDGMAIGAAFSNSITGGFSTAVAVFCHELPHELGDFAVLLKAGMSARKAAYYNILSSVLSFLGMVLGVIVGDTPEASAWIFACAAGMFIYIALVDMMPELTTAHNEHSAILQCFIQFLGMIIGVSIMLLIALFENDLKLIFNTDDQNEYHSHHHHHDH